ncbi:uncharacterized protein LOC132049723 isoform X2 [Lycium ferocissimum]|uniref:uncharacterized protein LOC132049723 isoform X2 n=1 Tax=Lycium ferocissimum TaxID=112874 RepID=UPI0028157F6E|nr:uncharacterized protein LOC132049723 isoform X2 [Lycium ferocissimum]XP_059296623.1 uncharacterized protein LOC132049723 isoform X2 [Lycium ferocissimum]
MGTSCLCSTTLCRYPQWMVSYGYTSHNSPKRLQITATTTITEKQTRVSATTKARKPIITAAILAAAAAVIVAVNGADAVAVAAAAKSETQQEIIGEETFSNVPQTLSGDCSDGQKECKKARIQRPKSRQAESCTVKCVNTCIRGGSGSPGEGPLNVRSLVECSDICNLIKDGEDGP